MVVESMTEPRDDARGELLACPLCQSNDLQVGSCYQEGSSERQAAVRCAKCGCRSTLLAWNTRPASLPQCEAEPVTFVCPRCGVRGTTDGKCSNVKGDAIPPSRSDAGSADVDHDAHALWASLPRRALVPPPSEAGREAIARAIYLAMYESRGGRWEANETKGVWHDIADKFCAILRASPDPGTVAVTSTHHHTEAK
jgi:hypothetical protein